MHHGIPLKGKGLHLIAPGVHIIFFFFNLFTYLFLTILTLFREIEGLHSARSVVIASAAPFD